MKDQKHTLPRACWFRLADGHKWLGGTLHAWGTDFEEFESGPGLLPVGIVEDNCGDVHSVYVNRITFASCPGQPTEGSA